jgi:hypothetical protein
VPSGNLSITLNPASSSSATTLGIESTAALYDAGGTTTSSTLVAVSQQQLQSDLRTVGMMSMAAMASGLVMETQVSDATMVQDFGSAAGDMAWTADVPALSLAASTGLEKALAAEGLDFDAAPVANVDVSMDSRALGSFEDAPVAGLADIAEMRTTAFAMSEPAAAEAVVDAGFASAMPMADAMGGMEALLMLGNLPAAEAATVASRAPADALADLGAEAALDMAIDYFAAGDGPAVAGLGSDVASMSDLAGMLDTQVGMVHAGGMGPDVMQDAVLALETANNA